MMDSASNDRTPVDLLLVGGGLANGLIAARLAILRPDIRTLLVEAGDEIGGNHTWSFHDGDLTASQHAWLEPFVAHRWRSYDVFFPNRRRTVRTGYRSVSSERFRDVLTARLGTRIRTGAPVAFVEPDRVTLADGTVIQARGVIDGRGQRSSPHLQLGFQKFLGREIELVAPHGLQHPIVMDATVRQADGYRFVYVLPFSPTRLLVEDTYYADGADLDGERLRGSIAAYLDRGDWQPRELVREENGILPIALGGDIEAFWAERNGVPASGLAAALFHPTTGYSLPDAVRLADRVAASSDLSSPALFALLRDHSVALWHERAFFRMLNRLLFLAGDPAERYRILQHFYRLPDPLVARFYAGDLRISDKLRILTGKPPVSITSAVRVLVAGAARREHA